MRPPETKKVLRCAVYTRVSTEYGLEQEFNSLDAQRESSEAYVKSQAHEGWRCLPTQYNDRGFSGGSLNRPALQKLLSDIRDRLVDVVVVYKVDRLTRSLADFAKLVELFDAHGVSFVSVTQAFNTTTSMGRLTLNVLLSFAQFEREVTGERIRDKVAASKRKGMRMGGPVPLGYDVKDKKLVINPEEAERVRTIFRQYLKLKSITKLLDDLHRRKILTKRTARSNGRVRGGIDFSKGSLAYLLKNRVYIGDIVHKGKHYTGEHPALLDVPLFEAVQSLMVQTGSRRRTLIQDAYLLTGKIFDARGNRMVPITARKGAACYRYYVTSVPHNRSKSAQPLTRLRAVDLETAVVKALHEAIGADPAAVGESGSPESQQAFLDQHLERFAVHPEKLEIRFSRMEQSGSEVLAVPWSSVGFRRKRKIIDQNATVSLEKPIRSESRARLIEAIAKGRYWLAQLIAGEIGDTQAIATRLGCSDRQVRMTLSLAFLNPAIVKDAVDGRLPRGVGVAKLTDLREDWEKQTEVISFSN
jgi:site-specific DNA recombinase